MPKGRRWQATIEMSMSSHPRAANQIISVYGESIDELREHARMRLVSMRTEDKLLSFSNSGDLIRGKIMYFYSNGLDINRKSWQQERLEQGWWYQEEKDLHNSPKRLNSFGQAVDHFVAQALIPERGPEYQSRALVGSNLRLPLLEKILREAEEYPINDLIQRGWHIIALEYKGELSMTGELTNRRAIFVMGHPEAQAAAITLSSDLYKKS